jgi:hypothetical protein
LRGMSVPIALRKNANYGHENLEFHLLKEYSHLECIG